jgi:hypothetical protein
LNIIKEAEIISRYLIGEKPINIVIQLYNDTLCKKQIQLDEFENILWRIILKYPFIIGAIDGGLCLMNPLSNLRKKIFIMSSILEVTPEYCKYFFSPKCSKFYLIRILFVNILMGIFRAATGILIINIIKLIKIRNH